MLKQNKEIREKRSENVEKKTAERDLLTSDIAGLGKDIEEGKAEVAQLTASIAELDANRAEEKKGYETSTKDATEAQKGLQSAIEVLSEVFAKPALLQQRWGSFISWRGNFCYNTSLSSGSRVVEAGWYTKSCGVAMVVLDAAALVILHEESVDAAQVVLGSFGDESTQRLLYYCPQHEIETGARHFRRRGIHGLRRYGGGQHRLHAGNARGRAGVLDRRTKNDREREQAGVQPREDRVERG